MVCPVPKVVNDRVVDEKPTSGRRSQRLDFDHGDFTVRTLQLVPPHLLIDSPTQILEIRQWAREICKQFRAQLFLLLAPHAAEGERSERVGTVGSCSQALEELDL